MSHGYIQYTFQAGFYSMVWKLIDIQDVDKLDYPKSIYIIVFHTCQNYLSCKYTLILKSC